MNEVKKIELEHKKKILMAIRSTLGSLRLESNSNIQDSDITDEVIEEIYDKVLKLNKLDNGGDIFGRF